VRGEGDRAFRRRPRGSVVVLLYAAGRMLHLNRAQAWKIYVAALRQFVLNNSAERLENVFRRGTGHSDLGRFEL